MADNREQTVLPHDLDSTAKGHGESSLHREAAFEAITDVFIPVCILGMATSFSYFLIEVRAVWSAFGLDALRYACFWFLMAVVLISRLRTKYGGELVAAPYEIALGGAMLLFIFRFSMDVGGITVAKSSPLLVNCLIIAVAWWGISRLTDECTVEEGSTEETEEGLLSSLKSPSPRLAAQETRVTEQQLSRDLSRRRRHPGRLVIYFSLAALLVFGVCQKALALGGAETAKRAFYWMVAYIFFSLFLLALTSLSGLRLYLHSRGLKMSPAIPAKWMSTATFMIVALLLMSAFVPRLTAAGRDWVVRNMPGVVHPRSQEFPLSSPVEGFRAPHAETETEAGRSSAGERTSGTDREANLRRTGEGKRFDAEGEQPEPDRDAGRGSGKEQSGEGEGNSPSNNRNQDRLQNQGPKSPPEQRAKANTRQNEQKTEEQRQNSSDETRRTKEPQREHTDLPLRNLLRMLGVFALVALAMGAVIFLMRQSSAFRAMGQFWQRWLASVLSIVERWRRRFSSLFRRKGRVGAARLQPGRIYNPFRETEFFLNDPPAEAVRRAYAQFLDYAEMRGFPRREQWTPIEFLRNLPESFDSIREALDVLTRLYVLASYTPMQVTAAQVEELRSRWDTLIQDAEVHLFGAGVETGFAIARRN